MACSECDSIRREYLMFRKAVARFGLTLDQLENERRRKEAEREFQREPRSARMNADCCSAAAR